MRRFLGLISLFATTSFLVSGCGFGSSNADKNFPDYPNTPEEDSDDIYDKDGSREGFIQKGTLNEDHLILYDNKGNRKGYIEPDPLNKDRSIIYDSNGMRKGVLEKDILIRDRTNIR